MLAVEAGASYEHAASSFCIEPEFEHTSRGTGSVFLFWSDREKYLGRNISARRGQHLPLTDERVKELLEPGAFTHAFHIFQKRDRSDLEEAITRAVYWYGDAHRDLVPVMQFVKYWSCLECLLGGPGKELTETLSFGVVAVLTAGHFPLLKKSEWNKNVKLVKRLYALRSRAIHRASHTHITSNDLVLLSTWAAWTICNSISLSHAGMRNPKSLWQQVQVFASKQEADRAGDASKELLKQ